MSKSVITINTKQTRKPRTTDKAKKVAEVVQVNEAISALYAGLVNHQGEIRFIREVGEGLKSGAYSVRIVQASIESASFLGSAPTIKKGHVQYIASALQILESVEGADMQPVAKLLKLATRVQRSAGVENVGEALKDFDTYAELEESTPALDTRSKVEKAKAEVTRDADGILLATLAGLKSLKREDLKVTDLATLNAMNEILKIIAGNSGAKRKVKAA